MVRRILVFLVLSLAVFVLAGGPAAAHDFGQVTVDPGIEVTQSMQTLPQVAGDEFGIGLSAHKPTAIRAYLRATRFRHFSFGFFVFHLADFAPVSVNGTLTIKRVSDNVTLATLPATNGPLALTPWATPNPASINSSLNFDWSFPPSDLVRFELDLTTSTPGITAFDPASTTRSFVHNRRLRVQAVKVQYDHDSNPATPPTKSPLQSRVLDGKNWFLKSGPLAPCKLQYWANPTPLQWTTDLTATSASAGLLNSTLAGMQVQGSVTYDNVYGWWEGAVSGNGWAQVPASCAGAPRVAAHGNTDPARYQRTFTHELYHNYHQQHRADGSANWACDAHPGSDPGPAHPNGELHVVGWDTDFDLPVPATQLDVMVAGQLTAAAWQDPARYGRFWNLWDDPGPESIFDPCHFNWWIPEIFQPFGPLTPIEERLKPGKVILINGIVDPTLFGKLWPAWQVETRVPIDPPGEQGAFSVELVGLSGQVVDARFFDLDFEGDSKEPGQASFSFVLPPPMDAAGGLDLTEIRLMRGSEILDTLRMTSGLPSVQILAPSPQETPDLDKPFALRWSATDADGDEIYTAVQYSPDDGQHFLPLANNLETDVLMLDPLDLPGGASILLRVMVSDGINTSLAVAGPFRVPRKGPTVVIESPEPQRAATVVAAGSPLVLQGSGYSPDDGVLPGDRLEWSSDLDGPLGAGYVAEARLGAGLHRITLRGTDKMGVQATAEVSVDVVPFSADSDGDGTPDYADRCPLVAGPPENDGCPYDPTTLPLEVKVTTRDAQGSERQAFDSFFDVFFDVSLRNPRPVQVSIAGILSHLTDPAGIVGPMFHPSPQDLGPGETRNLSLSFFDVFTGQQPAPGPYAAVFEANGGPNSPLGRGATFFGVQPGLRDICIGSAFGEPGTSVSVPIVLDDGDGVAGFQVDVGFDPTFLLPAGASLGADTSAAGGWSISNALVGLGQLRVLASSNPPAGLAAGPREVALVAFDISAASPFGPLPPFTMGNCVLSDPEGRSIPCEICPQPGRIVVRNASSFRWRLIGSPVGVDQFDPLPFTATVEALDFFGSLASSYGGTADISVGPLCGGTLAPASLPFSSGAATASFRIACCLDPLLPDTTTPLALTAADASIAISGGSLPFEGTAKGDLDSNSSVNVLDVTRAVRLALGQSVATPPPLLFQRWAANMLDQACVVDASVNVLDVVRIRNKALGRPPLCPCSAGGVATVEAGPYALTAAPVTFRVVKEGSKDFLIRVEGAADLSGLQIDLKGLSPKAVVSLEGLTAGGRWQATTSYEEGVLRVLAFSNDASGLAGDGAVLRLSGGGHPRISAVVASDTEGRRIPADAAK